MHDIDILFVKKLNDTAKQSVKFKDKLPRNKVIHK
jgi:hypothetical protein